MKKYLKIILFVLVAVFNVGALISPVGRALDSSATSRVWTYSLYTRIFGGGLSTSSTIGNTPLITFAWCLSVMTLIVIGLLITFYFLKIEISKLTSIILYGSLSIGYLLSSLLYFCIMPIIGNTTDATIGLGTILTGSFMLVGFVVMTFVLLHNVLSQK